jgi:hypothetical protein
VSTHAIGDDQERGFPLPAIQRDENPDMIFIVFAYTARIAQGSRSYQYRHSFILFAGSIRNSRPEATPNAGLTDLKARQQFLHRLGGKAGQQVAHADGSVALEHGFLPQQEQRLAWLPDWM